MLSSQIIEVIDQIRGKPYLNINWDLCPQYQWGCRDMVNHTRYNLIELMKTEIDEN